ncbi:hypothetical protein BJV77DRAFT_247614 [Russula vinacea]|nr:hypothetical protein BJV77DRAFT_247614 [Russula vinacea]
MHDLSINDACDSDVVLQPFSATLFTTTTGVVAVETAAAAACAGGDSVEEDDGEEKLSMRESTRQALAQMRVRTRRAAGAPCKWPSFFRCLRQDMMQRVKTPSAGTCWGTRVSWLLGSSRYRALESSIMHLKGLRPSYSIIHRVWHAISHILITMGFLWCCVLYSGDTADWSTQGTGARPSSPK